MLIYLIIAAEFAILYTVFWYVYVRDPKPYKVVGNPWGKYGDDGFTAGGIDPTLPITVNRASEIARWWQAGDASEAYGDDVAYVESAPIERASRLKHRRIANKCCPSHHSRSRTADPQGFAGEAPFITRMLDMFSRTMGSLNVRVP